MTRLTVPLVLILFLTLNFKDCEAGFAGYWRFEEGAGSSSVDSSGNGNVATLGGSATWGSDVFGSTVPQNGLSNAGSLMLNGSTSYAEVGPASILQPTSAITVEAWVRREIDNGVHSAGIVGTQYGADHRNSFNLFIRNNQSSIGFEITNTLGQTAAAELFAQPLAMNKWYHLAGVYDGSQIRLYIDGILAASQAFNGDIGYARANRVLIGADNEGNPFNPTWFFPGSIDEVRIGDQALDPTQFLNAAPVPEPASLAMWGAGAFGAFIVRRRRQNAVRPSSTI